MNVLPDNSINGRILLREDCPKTSCTLELFVPGTAFNQSFQQIKFHVLLVKSENIFLLLLRAIKGNSNSIFEPEIVEMTQLIVANKAINYVFDQESLEAGRGVNNVHFENFFQPKLLFMMSSLTYFMH